MLSLKICPLTQYQHHLDFLKTLSSKIEALYQTESSDDESNESCDDESQRSINESYVSDKQKRQ